MPAADNPAVSDLRSILHIAENFAAYPRPWDDVRIIARRGIEAAEAESTPAAATMEELMHALETAVFDACYRSPNGADNLRSAFDALSRYLRAQPAAGAGEIDTMIGAYVAGRRHERQSGAGAVGEGYVRCDNDECPWQAQWRAAVARAGSAERERDEARAKLDAWVKFARDEARLLGVPDEVSNGSIADVRTIRARLRNAGE